MATSNSHLLIFFCATAGKNGEELGNDEEQIVLFVYLLYDVSNCKVRNLQVKRFPALLRYSRQEDDIVD